MTRVHWATATVLLTAGTLACDGPTSVTDPGSAGRSVTETVQALDHRHYSLIDLGTGLPNAPGLVPFEVNDNGVVVGMASYGIVGALSSCAPKCGTAQGWIYKHGTLSQLPTLSGDVQSIVDAVNDQGVASGGSAGVIETAVLWEPSGSIVKLGTGLGGPGGSAEAIGISDAGRIVGISVDATGIEIPTQFYENAPATAPCGAGQQGFFWAVNNAGLAVGDGTLTAGGVAAISCAPFTVIETPPQAGEFDFAFDVNDAGQVVGRISMGPVNSDFHGFLYDHGRTTDLGTLFPGTPTAGSAAFGINNKGQIVGFSTPDEPGHIPLSPRAFLYENGTMIDLNSLLPSDRRATWTLVFAKSISNNGKIVGSAWVGGYPNGVEHGFLLTPEQ
jgi:probable HAF family extracellular repeat protein